MVAAAIFFPLLGIIIGALLQYAFTRNLDSLRARREYRAKAYTDYVRCVGEQAHPNQMTSSDGHELDGRTADAKCRICLYGSPEVIAAFAQFERLGAVIRSPEQRSAFTGMFSVMRRDSAISADVAVDDLQAVLLGVERHVA